MKEIVTELSVKNKNILSHVLTGHAGTMYIIQYLCQK